MTAFLGNQDNVLQVVQHTWNTEVISSAGGLQDATGSSFNFTPKSPTSTVFISADIAVDLDKATTTYAGSSFSLNYDGVACHQYTGGTEIYIDIVGITDKRLKTRMSLDGSAINTSLTSKPVALQFDPIASTVVTINIGSIESKITIVEVEKA